MSEPTINLTPEQLSELIKTAVKDAIEPLEEKMSSLATPQQGLEAQLTPVQMLNPDEATTHAQRIMLQNAVRFPIYEESQKPKEVQERVAEEERYMAELRLQRAEQLKVAQPADLGESPRALRDKAKASHVYIKSDGSQMSGAEALRYQHGK